VEIAAFKKLVHLNKIAPPGMVLVTIDVPDEPPRLEPDVKDLPDGWNDQLTPRRRKKLAVRGSRRIAAW